MRWWCKAPSFWWKSSLPWWGYLLIPLSKLWTWGGRFRECWTPRVSMLDLPPIISVGNSVIGGSGKTPSVQALAQYLQTHGWAPVIVCKGYQGQKKGTFRVDHRAYTPQEVGEEAWILSQSAMTWIVRDVETFLRVHIPSFAYDKTVIILDDGHQSLRWPLAFRWLVIDHRQKFGNKRIIPAGPLREPLAHSTHKADGILHICYHASQVSTVFKPGALHVPMQARYTWSPGFQPSRPTIGFAGIGFPKKFLLALQNQGIRPLRFITYPDHHHYTFKDWQYLQALARQYQAQLITTEKDAVKLDPSWRVYVLKQRYHIAPSGQDQLQIWTEQRFQSH